MEFRHGIDYHALLVSIERPAQAAPKGFEPWWRGGRTPWRNTR